MRVLITGANGFLGYSLSALLLKKGVAVIATGSGPCRLPFQENSLFRYIPMDITVPAAVHQQIKLAAADIIVHTAAMSKPDECELHPEKAYAVNVRGTAEVLEAAASIGSHFLFLSTDFIFDGQTGMYQEEDPPGPVNYYGQTKLEAELLTRQYPFDYSIARTVLVYGNNRSGRKNILGMVKEKLEKGEVFKVVDDQLRTPTFIEDLSFGIWKMIEQRPKGIFHIAGEEQMTPYEMAVRTAKFLGYNVNLLQRVNASTFTEPAKRPLKTGFDITKAKKELGYQPVPFEKGLELTFYQK
ncbi:MAG: SDR family oxidoreductase [Chitinophagaceae bacterium]|nr:SDR family oxidoreductase [Chitinophagaceae bacterium]